MNGVGKNNESATALQCYSSKDAIEMVKKKLKIYIIYIYNIFCPLFRVLEHLFWNCSTVAL